MAWPNSRCMRSFASLRMTTSMDEIQSDITIRKPRRARRRSFCTTGGRCSATWVKVPSRNSIGWWKSQVRGWRGLWPMFLSSLVSAGWLRTGRGRRRGVAVSWPANPKDPCTERAIILNVYTELEFRKRGIARQVMQAILAWIKERGLRSVNLHASAEGRGLYEKLGFAATNEMRLRF